MGSYDFIVGKIMNILFYEICYFVNAVIVRGSAVQRGYRIIPVIRTQ